MKKMRAFVSLVLGVALLLGSARATGVFCAMASFGNLAGRYAQIENDVKKWVQDKVGNITADTGRWGTIAAAEREGYAALEVKGALGSAEKAASKQGASVGSETANAYLTMINSDTMGSTRTKLADMAEGVGAAVAASGVDDVTMAASLRGAEAAMTGQRGAVFRTHNYTPAELGGDLKTLLVREAGDKDPAAIIRPSMWTRKLNNAENGAVAEIAVAARLKSPGGHTHIEIGADEVPGPLHNAKVDIVTDTELHQVGLQSSTITDKLKNEMDATAAGIKQALDAQPGKTFYFSFVHDNGLPLQSTIDDLNSALKALYAQEVPPRLPPQTFEAKHFRLFSIDP